MAKKKNENIFSGMYGRDIKPDLPICKNCGKMINNLNSYTSKKKEKYTNKEYCKKCQKKIDKEKEKEKEQ